MDSFNKVISFVLGLVVVIVFFLVLTGKINLKNKLSTTPSNSSTATKGTSLFNFGGSNVTPTPTETPAPISSIAIPGNHTYNQTSPTVNTGKTIPSTGLPTFFIPMLFSGLIAGGFLSQIGKRKA